MPRLRKTALDLYRESQASSEKKEISGIEGFLQLLMGDAPSPTQRRFILDPVLGGKVAIRGYIGQWGSGKTVSLAAMGLMRCIFQPGYKLFVSRYDYNDLTGTTAAKFEEVLQKLPPGMLLGRDKSPPMRWMVRPAFEGPESEITFMALKEALGSREGHCWLVDEADEIEEKRAFELEGRVRAPGYTDYTVGFAFNPPNKTHWLYKACTGRNEKEEQVGAPWIIPYRSLPRENEKHLRSGYYDQLAEKLPEDMYQRYVMGEWGSVFEGDPVYREFKYAVHTRDNIEYEPEWPLYRWWDFGYNRPACLWVQPTPAGGLRILREEIGHMVEIKPFARRIIKMTNEHYWNHAHASKEITEQDEYDILDWGDPAVRQKKDTGSTLADLISVGIRMRFKVGQKVRDRLTAVRQQLRQLTDDGDPAILIDRRNCPVVLDGFKGGYRLKDDGETPFKDGFYEHPMDALGYGVLLAVGPGNYSHINDNRLPASLEYDPKQDFYGSVR